MPKSPKRIRDDLMTAVATLVEEEQQTLDIIERFQRVDRIKSGPAVSHAGRFSELAKHRPAGGGR